MMAVYETAPCNIYSPDLLVARADLICQKSNREVSDLKLATDNIKLTIASSPLISFIRSRELSFLPLPSVRE